MALIPMLFSNWWEDLDRPHSLLDQHFGLGLRPDQLSASCYAIPGTVGRPRLELQRPGYYRPWGDLVRHGSGGSSVIKAEKDQFKVVLDVQQFNPEEISVKVVDKTIVVEAKHEEKRDEHGWISRQFQRRYLIPDQCNIDQVASSLSSDGILTITVPRKDEPKTENEKTIKIEHTGKPAVEEAPQNAKGATPKEQKKVTKK